MILSKEKLGEIISELQKIFRVQDWEIDYDIVTELEIKDKAGCVCRGLSCKFYSKKYAALYFNFEHEEMQTIEEFYRTIVHEVIHIVCSDYDAEAEVCIDEIESKQMRDFMRSGLKDELERLVENLEKTFCTIYPVTNFITPDMVEGDAKE